MPFKCPSLACQCSTSAWLTGRKQEARSQASTREAGAGLSVLGLPDRHNEKLSLRGDRAYLGPKHLLPEELGVSEGLSGHWARGKRMWSYQSCLSVHLPDRLGLQQLVPCFQQQGGNRALALQIAPALPQVHTDTSSKGPEELPVVGDRKAGPVASTWSLKNSPGHWGWNQTRCLR